MSNFYKKNRENLLKNILDDNFFIILFSGNKVLKSGDQFYPFSVNKNFFYITGLKYDNLIFFSHKHKGNFNEFLFIPPTDDIKSKWEGDFLTPVECEKISGIKNIRLLNEFDEFFSEVIFKNNINKGYLDLENRCSLSTPSTKLANKIKKLYPYIQINNIYQNFANLRAIKQEEEIEKIKKAIDITEEGIYSIMKNAKPNLMEYQLEAYFDFTLKQNGVNRKSFETILASGKNATILHYQKNNSKIESNNLVLIDLGATFEEYCADISRTFPINKKFSDRQKEFYKIVLEAQELAIENIKPNTSMLDLQNLVKDYYFKQLSKLKIVTTKEDVDKYYYHGLGHPLGLDAHDSVCDDFPILKENMVITIEPGLYINEEKIGIRIEDDILVTKNGCENLSKNIIKSIRDIEEFMKGH